MCVSIGGHWCGGEKETAKGELRLPCCRGGWPADEGAVLKAREGFLKGALVPRERPPAALSRRPWAAAEQPGCNDWNPHPPQEKVSAGRAGGAFSDSGPQACYSPDAAPGLGCCSKGAEETPNAASEAWWPGRVGPPRNPGGASRVASAGPGRAHARGARGCGGTGAAGAPSCSAAAAGCRRWRNRVGCPPCAGGGPSPAPSWQARGRGPHQARHLEALSARVS